MWKKFLAALAIVGLMSTYTASAVVVDEPAPDDLPAGNVVSSLSVSSTSFNPSAGETNMVTFDLTATTGDVYAYVVDSTMNVKAVFANHISSDGDSFVWYGKQNNTSTGTALPNGTYTVKVFAFDAVGTITGFAYKTVQIVSEELAIPGISGLKADPASFVPSIGEDTEISFTVSESSFVTVEVRNSVNTVVRTFTDYDGDKWYSRDDTHSINWNGKNDDNAFVQDGSYTVKVKATNEDGSDEESIVVTVQANGTVSRGVIKDFTLDPSDTWDPTDEELAIEFELTSEVDDLTIDAKKGTKVIEILDDSNLDDDDYEESWDGTDEDGDFVEAGMWEIIIRADGDVVSRTVNVAFEHPEIADAFVTKASFDPEQGEFTTLVFQLEADAVVTVEVYKGSHKEMTLIEDEAKEDDAWHTVKWDGTDEGDVVKDGSDWKFKIIAENPVDDDIFDTEIVEVDVQEDEVSSTKVNVVKDNVTPVVFDREKDGKMKASYCIDGNADVYLAVYEGSSTSGSPEAEVLNYVSRQAGCHTEDFSALDKGGKRFAKGVWTYKVISRTDGNRKDTEVGKFVVGGTSKDTVPTPTTGKCGSYPDTVNLSDKNICDAIEWATAQGIFKGYADGSFGPNNDITRAEVLKVVLLAFGTQILPIDGTNLGFPDVNPDAWYMPYVRTAKFYGMIHGYNDGKAGLDRSVSRAELLKFALEGSESFTNYVVPKYNSSFYADVKVSDWFVDYAGVAYSYMLFNEFLSNSTGRFSLLPNQSVKRGEAALLLHRMSQGGLL